MGERYLPPPPLRTSGPDVRPAGWQAAVGARKSSLRSNPRQPCYQGMNQYLASQDYHPALPTRPYTTPPPRSPHPPRVARPRARAVLGRQPPPPSPPGTLSYSHAITRTLVLIGVCACNSFSRSYNLTSIPIFPKDCSNTLTLNLTLTFSSSLSFSPHSLI